MCLLDEHGRATGVPWASRAERIVVVWQVAGGYVVADVEAERLGITPGTNMIGEPRDTVVADLASLAAVPVARRSRRSVAVEVPPWCGRSRCAPRWTRRWHCHIEHATSREQFGRPLSKFQAVQHLISDIAAEAALARSATEAALSDAVTSDWSAPQLEFLVAAARSCTGHAASVVVRNAHQVHGAMGTTSEHRLHEFTRAALAWRSEFGSVQYWDDRVTDMALQAGANGLWGLISP